MVRTLGFILLAAAIAVFAQHSDVALIPLPPAILPMNPSPFQPSLVAPNNDDAGCPASTHITPCAYDAEKFCKMENAEPDNAQRLCAVSKCLESNSNNLCSVCAQYVDKGFPQHVTPTPEHHGRHRRHHGKSPLPANCKRDAFRLCPSQVMNRDIFGMANCLNGQFDELSDICKSDYSTSVLYVCKDDRDQFCPGMTSMHAVRNCMKQQESRLSASCQSARAALKAKSPFAACEADKNTFCGDKHGFRQVKKCMKAHSGQLSSGCKDAIAAWKSSKLSHEQCPFSVCKADKEMFCPNGDWNAVKTCMQMNKISLSKPCQDVMTKFENMKMVCASDETNFCSNIPSHEMRHCMNDHWQSLSDVCKAARTEFNNSGPSGPGLGRRLGGDGHGRRNPSDGPHSRIRTGHGARGSHGRHEPHPFHHKRRPLPKSCKSDIRRLCDDEASLHDIVGVVMCLNHNLQAGGSLSQQCATEYMDSPFYLCDADMKLYCSDEADNMRSLHQCLARNKGQLSSVCSYAIHNFGKKNSCPILDPSTWGDADAFEVYAQMKADESASASAEDLEQTFQADTHSVEAFFNSHKVPFMIGGAIAGVCLLICIACCIYKKRQQRHSQMLAAMQLQSVSSVGIEGEMYVPVSGPVASDALPPLSVQPAPSPAPAQDVQSFQYVHQSNDAGFKYLQLPDYPLVEGRV